MKMKPRRESEVKALNGFERMIIAVIAAEISQREHRPIRECVNEICKNLGIKPLRDD